MEHQPHTQKRKHWWNVKDIRRTVIFTVILTPIIGFLSGYVQVRLLGSPASQTMKTTENLVYLFTWAAAPVAALVTAMVLVALTGSRHHGDNPPPEAEHQIRNSPRANIIWVLGSGILCLFAVIAGMLVLQQDNESILDENAAKVNVVGQQWVWNYDYPESAGVRSNELHLVINKPVVFHVTSVDVKHSFWIVELGVKVDANPAVTTEVAVTPNKLGVFKARCAELCGLMHSYMQNEVYVQTQAEYDRWISTQPKRNFSGAAIPGEKVENPKGGKA